MGCRFNLDEWRVEAPDNTIVIQDNRVQWIHTDRTLVRYISKETLTRENFRYSFIVCIDEGYVQDQKNRGLIRLWEVRNDWDNRVWIYARKTTSGWTVHYEQRYVAEDMWAYHGTHVFPFGHRFIVELERDKENYRLQVFVEEKVMIQDSGWINGINQDFNWIWLASSIKSRRNNGNWSSGYIENFSVYVNG